MDQVASLNDRQVTEAFAAVLSEYIHSCEAGGVPDLDYMRRIAAEPPKAGTGETVDHDEPEQPASPKQIYQPLYDELWGVIQDFSADELATLRSHAAAIRTRRS